MDRNLARPHGACKGCGRRFTHKLYLVWSYCADCSPRPLLGHICGSKGRAGERCADPEACGFRGPLDGDSYDDARARSAEEGGEG